MQQVTKTFEQKQKADRSWRHPFAHQIKRVVALDGVSLTIEKGEFVAYAGPNGAGKSTTFKLLCGMLAPQTGAVRVLGMDPMTQRIPLMHRVGVLFGNRTELWWDHPVRTSFAWKKTVWDIPDQLYKAKLQEVTRLLDLGKLMDTFVRELSLGQRMRADLGLMLLHAPELILLDEPTLGLDVLAKREMIDFLKTLNARDGTTILVTSHDLDDLTEMARRLVLIASGRIAFDGTADALRQAAGEKRRLCVVGPAATPHLAGTQLLESRDGRHVYAFDAARQPVQALLESIAKLQGVRDVELDAAPIETVIAQLYTGWRQSAPPAQGG